MKLTVITPVGPGHEDFVKRAEDSVKKAIHFNQGVFSRVKHEIIDDSQGFRGRSKARNMGMDDSDWYFFLDADDLMEEQALTLVKTDYYATFGRIKINPNDCPPNRRFFERNVYPCTLEDIKIHGASGTLSMGFFVKSEVAKSLLFDESLDAGEDFDFYLRLPNFIKIPEALVTIGYNLPSAKGPRGYENIDWQAVCQKRIDHHFRHHALLEASERINEDVEKL